MANLLSVVDISDDGPKRQAPGFAISDFGQISKANIQFYPLTILVGRNNTGKSYVASMLWALRSAGETFARMKGDNVFRAPAWFREYVDAPYRARRRPLEVRGDEVSRDLNEWMLSSKDAYIRDLLSYPGASIGSLSFTIEGSLWLRRTKSVHKAFAEFKSTKEHIIDSWEISWDKAQGDPDNIHSAYLMLSGNDSATHADTLYRQAICKLMFGKIENFSNSAAYVPAARTGLMLSLPSLYNSLIENFGLGEQDEDRGRFSLPTIRFLQRLTRERVSENNPFSDVSEFLQNNILKGSVRRNENRSSNFSYRPVGSEADLPLHVVSSMVSELAPLLHVLKQGNITGGLILEEPEAHLHLVAQRWMARAVAKLVNRGVPIVLTTHSDTFLQQINLLIQMNKHPNKIELMEKFGYSPEEILDDTQIVAYEFKPGESGTVVQRAAGGPNGIVVQSVNETLIDITTEALALDD